MTDPARRVVVFLVLAVGVALVLRHLRQARAGGRLRESPFRTPTSGISGGW